MPERDANEVLRVRPGTAWREVRAAYWTLARRYHPDGTAPDSVLMAELNSAYERLERDRQTDLGDRGPGAAVGPGSSEAWAAPAPGSAGGAEPVHSTQAAEPDAGSLLQRMAAAQAGDSPVIDFGEYAGWRIADVAAYDPRYLRGLSRQPIGLRYRAAIERALSEAGDPSSSR